MIRWLLPLLVAASALPAQAQPLLQPCRLDGLATAAQCGSLQRPLDPAQPQGAQITLHFAVLPALARNKLADPVFFLAGGPGQSAIGLAGTVQRLLERFGNRRDVVLIDQRGTGRSAPLQCPPAAPTQPLREAADPARQLQRLQACREALQKLPHGDLRHYSTATASADADAVRAALGAARINLVGMSYGTRAALDYMRQFPQQVRRAVLDGVAPPDMVLPQSFSTDNQAAFDALLQSCAQQPPCAAAHPQLRTQWQQLLAALPREVTLRQPLTGQEERLLLTRDTLLGLVRGPLYSPAVAAALPQALAEAAAGRFDALAGLAAMSLPTRRNQALAEGMHFSVVCSEDAPRMAAPTGVRDTPGADFGSSFAQLYQQVCADWPRAVVPAAFYSVPPAPAATLLLSGAADPATPPRHAQRTAAALGPKALSVVVPNTGHGVMAVPCMRDLVFRFINAETDAAALQLDSRCADTLPRPNALLPLQPPPQSSGRP